MPGDDFGQEGVVVADLAGPLTDLTPRPKW
jgi:hypothetical protein